MKRVEKLPAAFTLFEKMLGVLDFGVFEDAEGSEEEILSAIRQVLHAAFSFDPHRLRSLGCRRITEQVFFGDWYDSASGSLRRLGSYRTADGVELTNPTFKELSQLQIVAGAIDMPEAGSGGEFAYAFVETPYGIKGSPQEIQAVFEEIRDFILPPQQVAEISDWGDPRLPEVSDYFSAGMEYWGVFLFSIYTPSLRRLTVIAGSTTD